MGASFVCLASLHHLVLIATLTSTSDLSKALQTFYALFLKHPVHSIVVSDRSDFILPSASRALFRIFSRARRISRCKRSENVLVGAYTPLAMCRGFLSVMRRTSAPPMNSPQRTILQYPARGTVCSEPPLRTC